MHSVSPESNTYRKRQRQGSSCAIQLIETNFNLYCVYLNCISYIGLFSNTSVSMISLDNCL